MKLVGLHFLSFLLLSLQAACTAAESERCTEWAASGECESNPAYMLTGCKDACDARVKFHMQENKEELEKIASFYDLSAKDIDGNSLEFSSLRGKVVIVVNVASQCGYTESHYRELVELHTSLASTGILEILAFPCNQFGKQEPEECPAIKKFAQDKGAEFRLMDKIDVNGANASLVYKYLKKKADHGAITWNFATYFVVSPDGAIESYSGVTPMGLEGVVLSLMKEEL